MCCDLIVIDQRKLGSERKANFSVHDGFGFEF